MRRAWGLVRRWAHRALLRSFYGYEPCRCWQGDSLYCPSHGGTWR